MPPFRTAVTAALLAFFVGHAALAAPKKQAKKPADKAEAQQSRTGSPSMLPAEMRDRYLKMRFQVGDEQIQFELPWLIYQNLGRKSHIDLELKGKMLTLSNAELKKDSAGVAALVAPYKLTNNSPVFMHVFGGKGSPEQIQAVLKLAARFQGKLGKAWQPKGSLSDSVKAFYQAKIGVDCSGFAGNYAAAIGTKFGPNSSILAFAPPGKRVKKVDDIQPGQVLVWKDNSHIATIQGKNPDGTWAIIESAGDPNGLGAVNKTFEFKDGPGGPLAQVIKNGKKGGWKTTVYVASLK